MKKSGIKVDMISTQEIMKRLGVTSDGDVQWEATGMVCGRLTRYMPFRSGALSTDMKKIKSSTEIFVEGPYAHYQYEGKVWVDPVTHAAGFLTENGWRSRKKVAKVETDRKLDQKTGTKNDRAGPHWDRRLVAAEDAQMTADLQEYIERRDKK